MNAAISLPSLKCKRCGHSWHPRREEMPLRCANPACKSPYWNRIPKKPQFTAQALRHSGVIGRMGSIHIEKTTNVGRTLNKRGKPWRARAVKP